MISASRLCDKCHAVPATRYFPALPGDLAFCDHDADELTSAVGEYIEAKLVGWMSTLDEQIQQLPVATLAASVDKGAAA